MRWVQVASVGLSLFFCTSAISQNPGGQTLDRCSPFIQEDLIRLGFPGFLSRPSLPVPLVEQWDSLFREDILLSNGECLSAFYRGPEWVLLAKDWLGSLDAEQRRFTLSFSDYVDLIDEQLVYVRFVFASPNMLIAHKAEGRAFWLDYPATFKLSQAGRWEGEPFVWPGILSLGLAVSEVPSHAFGNPAERYIKIDFTLIVGKEGLFTQRFPELLPRVFDFTEPITIQIGDQIYELWLPTDESEIYLRQEHRALLSDV